MVKRLSNEEIDWQLSCWEVIGCLVFNFSKKVQLKRVRVVWVDREVAEWINSKINQHML